MTEKVPRTYIIDDNDAFRESTAWLLEDHGFEVHGFGSAPEFLQSLDNGTLQAQGASVLTDLRMPEMSGLELMERLASAGYHLPVVFVTGHGDVPLAVEAMRKGAANFLEKPVDEGLLVQSLQLAMRSPGARPRDPQRASDLLDRLSPREFQVMELVCSGKLNKTIADILDISIKTVELHRANMMHKLEARNVPELIHRVLGY